MEGDDEVQRKVGEAASAEDSGIFKGEAAARRRVVWRYVKGRGDWKSVADNGTRPEIRPGKRRVSSYAVEGFRSSGSTRVDVK